MGINYAIMARGAMAGAKTAHPAPNASTSSSMSVVIASKIFIGTAV